MKRIVPVVLASLSLLAMAPASDLAELTRASGASGFGKLATFFGAHAKAAMRFGNARRCPAEAPPLSSESSSPGASSVGMR